jgi:hypothetical protein
VTQGERTTWGLAILGLDVVSFNILSLSAFVPAGHSLLNFDGLIWTKHLLSPDEKLLAVFGCGWGSAFFVTVYHFDNPMELPLQIAFEPSWTGYDIEEWIDNKSLKVKKTEDVFEVLEL